MCMGLRREVWVGDRNLGVICMIGNIYGKSVRREEEGREECRGGQERGGMGAESLETYSWEDDEATKEI